MNSSINCEKIMNDKKQDDDGNYPSYYCNRIINPSDWLEPFMFHVYLSNLSDLSNYKIIKAIEDFYRIEKIFHYNNSLSFKNF